MSATRRRARDDGDRRRARRQRSSASAARRADPGGAARRASRGRDARGPAGIVLQAVVDGIMVFTRKFCCRGADLRGRFAAAVCLPTARFGMTVAMGLVLQPVRDSRRRCVMSRPRFFVVRMLLFLVLVAALAAALGRPLYTAFMGNPLVNGVILGILLAGIIYIFRQVLLLDPEIDWIESFRHARSASGEPVRPVAPGAAAVGVDGAHARRPAGSDASACRRPRCRPCSTAFRLAPRRDPRDLALSDRRADLSRPARNLLRALGDGALGRRRDRRARCRRRTTRPRLRQSEIRACNRRSPAWGPRSARRCSGSPAASFWAFSICRPDRRRTASTTISKSGCRLTRGCRAAGWATAATRRVPAYIQAFSSRPPTAWKTCSASWPAARRAGSTPT